MIGSNYNSHIVTNFYTFLIYISHSQLGLGFEGLLWLLVVVVVAVVE